MNDSGIHLPFAQGYSPSMQLPSDEIHIRKKEISNSIVNTIDYYEPYKLIVT